MNIQPIEKLQLRKLVAQEFQLTAVLARIAVCLVVHNGWSLTKNYWLDGDCVNKFKATMSALVEKDLALKGDGFDVYPSPDLVQFINNQVNRMRK